MTAILLLAALAADVALVAVAVRPAGFSGQLVPLLILLHDPSALLVLTAALAGSLVAVTWRGRARGRGLLAAIIAVAAVGAALTREAQRMFPLGDTAVLEMYVREALAGRLMLGPYSRFGWHHPGPIYFYLVAPLYRLGGANTSALAVGAASITIASLALAAWTAARSIGSRASAVLLLPLAFYLWRAPDLATSAWNPHVVVLPAVALIVSAAAMAGGDLLMAPVAVGLASFIVQTDLALAPVATIMVAASAAGCVAATWRTERGAARRWFNAAAWVAVAAWLVPLAEQISHTPGNLTLLWRFFVTGAGPGQTARDAAIAWASMLSASLRWNVSLASGGTFETSSPGTAVALAAGLLLAVVAIVPSAKRTDPALARLAASSALASLVALWSATRIADRIMDHELFWLGAIGALDVGIVLAAGVARITGRDSLRTSPDSLFAALVHGAVVFAVVGVCGRQLNRAREGHLPVTLSSPVAGRLGDSAQRYLDEAQVRAPLVRIGESVWGLAAGVLLDLDRAGVPFTVERSWAPMFPSSFGERGDEDGELVFGTYDEHLQQMARPASVSVASSGALYVDGAPRADRR